VRFEAYLPEPRDDRVARQLCNSPKGGDAKPSERCSKIIVAETRHIKARHELIIILNDVSRVGPSCLACCLIGGKGSPGETDSTISSQITQFLVYAVTESLLSPVVGNGASNREVHRSRLCDFHTRDKRLDDLHDGFEP
jgi:hypothetical protein